MSRVGIAALVVVALVPTVIAAVLLWPDGGDDSRGSGSAEAARAQKPSPKPEPRLTGELGPESDLVDVELKDPPRAGLMFDVDTGQVLWKRAAGKELAIASLTKMMTALLVSENHSNDEMVLISRRAAETNGSKLGVLPVGKKVRLRPLFYAMIMASANDVSVALAEHDAGSVHKFVKRMNLKARELGLRCSHFTTPSGLRDRGNHSCALDLAALARTDLADPRIARIVRTREASFPFPGKVGTLDLYNNHYFLTEGIAGLPKAEVTGLKTGLTLKAGRCYVTTARLGSRHLGVILLDTPDPFRQVPRLLRAGFGAQ